MLLKGYPIRIVNIPGYHRRGNTFNIRTIAANKMINSMKLAHTVIVLDGNITMNNINLARGYPPIFLYNFIVNLYLWTRSTHHRFPIPLYFDQHFDYFAYIIAKKILT